MHAIMYISTSNRALVIHKYLITILSRGRFFKKMSTMAYFQEKMVDRDALCLINVMSYKFNQLQHRPDKCSYF